MKTADFTSELAPNGQISVPPEIAAAVPAGERLHVALSWGPSDDDADWRRAGRRQFDAAYAADDSVYESLIHDTPKR